MRKGTPSRGSAFIIHGFFGFLGLYYCLDGFVTTTDALGARLRRY